MEIPRNPYQALAEALAGVIEEAVEQAVNKALAEILPHLTAPFDPVNVIDVPEAAARIGVSVSKTKRLIAASEIESVLIGRRRKVPVDAIENYIDRLKEQQLSVPGV
jgi:excisionase family DNA binding protein